MIQEAINILPVFGFSPLSNPRIQINAQFYYPLLADSDEGRRLLDYCTRHREEEETAKSKYAID